VARYSYLLLAEFSYLLFLISESKVITEKRLVPLSAAPHITKEIVKLVWASIYLFLSLTLQGIPLTTTIILMKYLPPILCCTRFSGSAEVQISEHHHSYNLL